MTVPQQMFKLHFFLKYAVITENAIFVELKAVNMIWFLVMHILTNLITKSFHTWLAKE